jgi:hypothetical protein
MMNPVADIGEARTRAMRANLERAVRLFSEAVEIIADAIEGSVNVAQPAPSPALAEMTIDAHAVAMMLGRSVNTVRDLARQGRIPAHPLPGTGSRKQWTFFASEIAAWIKNPGVSA